MYEEYFNVYSSMNELTAHAAAYLTSSFKFHVKPSYLTKFGVDERGVCDKLNPDKTYETFKNNPGAMIAVTSGPESGLTAITAYTSCSDSGLYTLVKNDWICPNCFPVTKMSAYPCIERHERKSFHTAIYYTGKERFKETALLPQKGIFVRQSGDLIFLPPGFQQNNFGTLVTTELTYECRNDPFIEGIRYMPDSLFNAIRDQERNNKHNEKISKLKSGMRHRMFDPVAEGGRNIELTKRAGYLIGYKKMDLDSAFNALQQINDECCIPPLGDSEVRKIVNSIYKKNSRHG